MHQKLILKKVVEKEEAIISREEAEADLKASRLMAVERLRLIQTEEQRRIEQFIEEFPKEAVQVLRNWLYEDDWEDINPRRLKCSCGRVHKTFTWE
jgi:ribosomal 50S subunit-associated protein YjgA (DUF615 family)